MAKNIDGHPLLRSPVGDGKQALVVCVSFLTSPPPPPSGTVKQRAVLRWRLIFPIYRHCTVTGELREISKSMEDLRNVASILP